MSSRAEAGSRRAAVPVDRRAHQLRIAALLQRLEEGRAELLRRQAFGATRVGLRDLKSELAATRRRLAEDSRLP